MSHPCIILSLALYLLLLLPFGRALATASVQAQAFKLYSHKEMKLLVPRYNWDHSGEELR